MITDQQSALRKWARPLLLLSIIAVAVLGLYLAYSAFFVKSPEDAAREFGVLVQQGKAGEAYDNYASDSFKATTTKEDWMLLTERIKPYIEGELVLNDEMSSEDSYAFKVQGTPYTLTINTEKDGGVKVRYFSSDRL